MDKFAFASLSKTVYVNLQVTRTPLLLTQASSVDMIGLSSVIPPPHWHCYHRGPTCLQWSVLQMTAGLTPVQNRLPTSQGSSYCFFTPSSTKGVES